MSRDTHTGRSVLPPDDAAALDGLVGAGFDPTRVDERLGRRAARLGRLLGLLDAGAGVEADAGARDRLVDATMARVMSARRGGAGVTARVDDGGGLNAGDRASVDALVEKGWTPGRDERSAAAASLLGLLDVGAAGDDGARSARVDATLAHLQREIERREARLRLDPVRPSEAGVARGRFGLRDLVGIAAVLVIGGAMLWPMLVSSRVVNNQTECLAGMQRAGFGFASYAADHDGALPRVRGADRSVGGDGGRWWDVGDAGVSHSANLFRLVRLGYALPEDLACPGNEHAPVRLPEGAADWSSAEQVSYSYQLFPEGGGRWDAGSTFVVLTDRSPVVSRAMRGESASPEMSSRNHGGRGQHVLLSDGGVIWTTRPYLPGSTDNLWVPRPLEGGSRVRLTGRERASELTDGFVGP